MKQQKPREPKTAEQLGHGIRKNMLDIDICIRCGASREFIEDHQFTCGQTGQIKSKRRKKL